MTLDPRYIGAGLAAIGIMAGAAGGYLKISTPEAAQCEVDLAVATTRLDLIDPIIVQCEIALKTCVTAEGK